jgi:formate dehydrogenase major subunit
MAECHPVGFQWVMEAKARGATVIHIDPRFTRTSAVADTHVPIRSGSDVVFLGAIVNRVLGEELDFRDYVLAYTNAAHLVNPDFQDTEDLDGLFSGFDPETRSYDTTSWQYAGNEESASLGDAGNDVARNTEAQHQLGAAGPPIEHADIDVDLTLQDPNCVWQLLKKHFARYTPELVEEVCGVPQHLFRQVSDAWISNSGRERTTAMVYSVGWTQRSVGVQYIRTGAILQLLLGNMGRPGGGIMALRGHASIQGSTDIPTLYNLLPGYLPMPNALTHDSLSSYLDTIKGKRQKGFWGNADAYTVNLLKAYWGEHATPENDFCFDHLPRIDGDHGTYSQVLDMIAGKIFGYLVMGQNPAVGSANGRAQRLGLANLDWLVVRDLVLVETATFWQNAPEIETGEIVPEECRTEVFFLPASSHVEKEGTFTQTQRMLQWREKAVEAPGECTSELWFTYHLGRRLRERLAGSTDPRDRALLELAWDYPVEGPDDEPSAEAVLREINGYDVATRRPLSSFAEMKADGSTLGGCWIYSGVFADGVNQAARRTPGKDQNWLAPEWGWAWPANRRILYNRASADPDGNPWSERKALVWWDEDAQRWTGHDVPDFQVTKPPHFQPDPDAVGPDALAGDDAFIMQGDGKGWLYAPKGTVDGPMPTHYEPSESPFRNAVYTQQQNPSRQIYTHRTNPLHPSPPEPHSEQFPYVWTTARLTEHHTAGGMSRFLPLLSELQPALFMELSPELARERGLTHLDFAHVVTARAVIEARVLVTDRMVPLRVQDRVVHQVWLPYHWGPGGLTTGDVVNDLPSLTLDPNVHIQECKAGTCDVRPGRRPRGKAMLALLDEVRERAGITMLTGTTARTSDLVAAGSVGAAHTSGGGVGIGRGEPEELHDEVVSAAMDEPRSAAEDHSRPAAGPDQPGDRA